MRTTINQTSAWALALVLTMIFFGITITMLFMLGDRSTKRSMEELELSSSHSTVEPKSSISDDAPQKAKSSPTASGEGADADGEVIMRADDVSPEKPKEAPDAAVSPNDIQPHESKKK